mgnify:CR=1 FL=1
MFALTPLESEAILLSLRVAFWSMLISLPVAIAVAWLLSKDEITAPVVGVSKISQLDQLVAATEITLEEADIAYLEELYKPVENLLSFGTS